MRYLQSFNYVVLKITNLFFQTPHLLALSTRRSRSVSLVKLNKLLDLCISTVPNSPVCDFDLANRASLMVSISFKVGPKIFSRSSFTPLNAWSSLLFLLLLFLKPLLKADPMIPPRFIFCHCGEFDHPNSSPTSSQIGDDGVNGSPAMNSALFAIVSKSSRDFAF